MNETRELQTKAINTIRFLSADAIQQAKSGHPGLPMGTAPMAFAIWMHHLRQRDYSRWFRDSIRDDGLADEAARIESQPESDAAKTRAEMRAAIEERYTLPA